MMHKCVVGVQSVKRQPQNDRPSNTETCDKGALPITKTARCKNFHRESAPFRKQYTHLVVCFYVVGTQTVMGTVINATRHL